MTAVSDAPPGAPPDREFFQFTSQRPVAIVMVVLAVVVFGWVGLSKLPVTLLPDISYPSVTIRTEYPGVSPEDMENLVSEPIQEAVSVASGVRRVISISRPEMSDVILEFAWDTPMALAVSELREKLDRVFLPEGAGQPLILRYDPTLDPIMTIGLSGGRSPIELRTLAEEEIEEQLSEVEGIAAVKVRGGDEEEIRVAVEENKLRALGVDVKLIGRRLQAENLNASAGAVDEGHTEYLVRTLNEFRSLEEIRNLIVERRNGQPIRVRDVAEVKRIPKEPEVISRIDGRPAVLMEIHKEAAANIVDLARRVRERLLGTEAQRAWLAKHPDGKADDPERPDDAGKTEEERKKNEKAHARAVLEKRREELRMTDYVQRQLPAGIELTVLSDQSRFIEQAVDDVMWSALWGGLLAVAVLYLFLKRSLATVIIAVSIPISILATFAPMFMSGLTMNIMSLGGLALGVGMLVDNSIVVLESITRRLELGESLATAAVRGVSKVAGAVTASTLTTVAVFFPIVFVEGVAGQLFREQALTVVYALLVSLAVSLTVIPMLMSRRMLSGDAPAADDAGKAWFARPAAVPWLPERLQFLRWVMVGWLWPLQALVFGGLWAGKWTLGVLGVAGSHTAGHVATAFRFGFDRLERAYPRALSLALTGRGPVLLGALGLSALAWYWGTTRLNTELLPKVSQGEMIVNVFLPRDKKLQETDRVVAPLEADIRALPGVAATYVSVGVQRDDLAESDQGKHSATIRVDIERGGDVKQREEEVRERIARLVAAIPEIESEPRFRTPNLFPDLSRISVEVVGRDLTQLRRLAADVEAELRQVDGLRDVRSSMHRGNPEVVIKFDREALSAFDLNAQDAAKALANKVGGEAPTRFTERDRKIDIRVVIDKEDVGGVRGLLEMNVNPRQGTPIPLRAVADVREIEGPSEIRRLGNIRGAEVTAAPVGLGLGLIQDRVEQRLLRIEPPVGFDVRMGSQKRDLEESTQSMTFALLLSIFLVYVVMAIQFESLVQPLVIMFTVPLALIGVVFALDAASMAVSVVVFLGCIVLAGIVVNNAIVMLDQINQLRAEGMDKRTAIVEGARIRLRPVLMTTMTTVLGLLPLTGVIGGGEGVELRAPMAITVICGLTFSTLLTLFVIPVIYTFADRRA